jgi:hypothetical protein
LLAEALPFLHRKKNVVVLHHIEVVSEIASEKDGAHVPFEQNHD